MMKSNIKLIGIGDEGRASLLPLYETFIKQSDVLVGGERQLKFFPDYSGEKVVIKGGLKNLVDMLQSEEREVVVLASGDPLFYGIGGYLSKKVDVSIYPYLSSVQLAFSRMGEKWQNAKLLSVHGRDMLGLAQKIDGEDLVAILTDEKNSPSEIAKYLLSFNMTEYEIFIGEHLGGEEERCRTLTLEEVTDTEFASLNIVILKRMKKGPSWSFGIHDEEFIQRKPEKGLITKKEIRTLSLGALGLKKDSIVWDIGTCTGSVAIEAARIAKDGKVFAIEKNEGDYQNCLENMKKFRTDFTVIHDKAPNGLETFDNPDAVFIGGTAGGMKNILKQCCERLNEGGQIVLNAVTIENLGEAVSTFKENGYSVDITLAQVSRSKPILNLTRFDALNPIYIISARREEGEK